jgi:hypothetical protein
MRRRLRVERIRFRLTTARRQDQFAVFAAILRNNGGQSSDSRGLLPRFSGIGAEGESRST